MERLLDASDNDLEQQLLLAGRDVELSPAAQARLLSVLGIGAGIAVASKAAASTGILGKLLGGKGALVAASAVSVGAISAGVYFTEFHPAEPPLPTELRAPQVTWGAAPTQVAPAAPTEDVAGTPRELTLDVAPRSAVPQSAGLPQSAQDSRGTEQPSAAAPRRAARVPASGARDGLGEELALVEAASKASKLGNPQLALQKLGEYRSKFPRGKLALEAQVLRIEALSQAGQHEQAAQLAKAILKRHPTSPVVARIRRYAD